MTRTGAWRKDSIRPFRQALLSHHLPGIAASPHETYTRAYISAIHLHFLFDALEDLRHPQLRVFAPPEEGGCQSVQDSRPVGRLRCGDREEGPGWKTEQKDPMVVRWEVGFHVAGTGMQCIGFPGIKRFVHPCAETRMDVLR